jgi:hypothetical protein
MVGEMLKLEAKIDWVYVPYPGGAPGHPRAGQPHHRCHRQLLELSAQLAAGRLRALA